jgi:putative chitinase
MSLSLFQSKLNIPQTGYLDAATLRESVRTYSLSLIRAAHFFGQVDVESSGFTILEENLNLSAQELANKWPLLFARDMRATEIKPNLLAEDLAFNQESIANTVYSNKFGNSSYNTSEGWKYRGRGILPVKGKDAYQDLSQFLNNPDILSNPDLVSTAYYFETGLYVFTKKNLWSICDRGLSREVVSELSRKLEGHPYSISDKLYKTRMYSKWLLSYRL